MSIRELPARPNLEHLKKQARTLLQQVLSADASAAERFAAFGATRTPPKLADALHVIAREYGFETWPALRLRIELESEKPAEALSAAIQANDAAVVRKVLARHPALKSSMDQPLPNFSFGAPAIIAAVQQENLEIIDALLDAGANINQRTRWWAGSFGVLDSASSHLAESLISRGAIVDIHAAARLGKIDRIRELLAVEPQLVHARGGDGQLPLHFASTVEIAALLIDHGADLNARDIDHESTAAQYMACSRQSMEWREPYRHDVARFLISRGAQADILMASAIGDVALVERILNDDPETIRTTVSERYFPKKDPKSGGIIYIYGFGWTRSPHMIARQFERPDVYALLMQRSPNWLRLINAAEAGDEAYFQRIRTEHPQLFQKLSGNAARRIIGVALRNNTYAVSQLLSAGWPSDAAMENGQTALHYAAWHGNLEMVRDLIAHKAPVQGFEGEHGGSPLAWALHGSLNSWERGKGDYAEVAKALLAGGAVIPKPDRPLEGTKEVLAVLERHSSKRLLGTPNQEEHDGPTRSIVLQEFAQVFAGVKSRLERFPSDQDGLICKHGFYMDSVVLKLQKASWTNDPMNQLQNETGIFFSVWVNEESIMRSRANYNIHALKLRHLKGYSITSRAFAEDFRDKFAPQQEVWPNVNVEYGPLTLMQGWMEISTDTAADVIYRLMRQFEQFSPLIDRLLELRRR